MERPLSSVSAQMDLEIAELSEVLVAVVALVLDATVALLQRIRQRLVAARMTLSLLAHAQVQRRRLIAD